MRVSEAIAKLNILQHNFNEEIEISGISYDSRKTMPGDVFVAISGFKTDGNRFIPTAIEKGAVLVVTEKVPECDCNYLIVDDSRHALAMLSCAFFNYPADRMKMIGITGTSGKTSTSYLIKHMLEECLDSKVGLIGTNGNMIGERMFHAERTTPESYELQKLLSEMLAEGCTHVVMEVSSHSLALHRVDGIHFTTGIYTNLSRDHLDFHSSMEDYAEAKSLLFARCDTSCINIDDDFSNTMIQQVKGRLITYSAKSHGADLIGKDIRLNADGVRFAAIYNNQLASAKLNIPGLFSVYNALSVISAGIGCGIAFEEAVNSLSSARGVKGRMEKVPVPGDFTVILDYSHKPDALEKVIRTLRPVTRGRLITLFGCGGDRDREKRPLMGQIASELSDVCIITSDNPRTEEPMDIINEILGGVSRKIGIHVICDRVEAIHYALDNIEPGDILLLAGKGHEDYQEIGNQKIDMDEYRIVTEYFQENN